MTIEGMDVEAATLLLGFIRNQEQSFEDIVSGVTGQVHALNWTGTDRNTFQKNWDDWSGQVVATAQRLIQDTSRALQVEIGKQQAASSS